ncbi:MAG: PaaI family thioesterase [Parvicellaceae bacterium]
MKAHYERLQKMYLNANINTMMFSTTTAKISEAKAEIGLTISKKHFHALGAIHGSVYFKLLDDSAYFAVSSLIKDYFILTTSFNLNIIKPASKGILTGIGKVKFQSKNIFTAESKIIDEQGNEIAFGTGNFLKSKVPLSKDIGY